jgi:hypothetical protein
MKPKILLLVGLAGLGLLSLPFVLRRREAAPTLTPAAPSAAPAPAPPSGATVPAPAAAAPVRTDPMREWQAAIQRKDANGVLGAQSMFLAREDDYRGPLMTMAREDAEPRNRAFSVAVLGRMRTPPPESFFVEKLKDKHDFPRRSALEALERLGTAACLAAVDGLASADPDELVRATAARTAKAVRSR